MNLYNRDGRSVVVPGAIWFELQGFWLWKKWSLDVENLELIGLRECFPNERLSVLQEVLLPQSATVLERQEAFRQLQEWGKFYGWKFFELPAYDDRQGFLAAVDDLEQKATFEEAFYVIDQEARDYHDMMHDIGAKGRAAVYANQPLSTYMLGIYQGT